MKTIFKYILSFTVALLCTVSCDYDDTNFDNLKTDPDPNATYYVQFKDANKSLETGVSPSGERTEIEAPISIALMGMPQSQDISVDYSVDPASTIAPDMYTIEGSSLVIPAGNSSGSTMLFSVSDNMPEDEVQTLILNLEAGEHNATAGTQLVYQLLRPAPCRPIPGEYTIEMHDSYGDGWQTDGPNGGSGITVNIDGTVVEFGMCTPYEDNNYDCTTWPDGVDPNNQEFTDASATVTIPEGSQSAKWFFPGDFHGEISFEIYDPNGTLVYSVSAGDGVAGEIPVEACLE